MALYIIFVVTLGTVHHFDGLVQERRNSIANALELRLSCTNPSICVVSLGTVKYIPGEEYDT